MDIIDALVVQLTLDQKNFVKGSKDAQLTFKKTKEQVAAAAKDIEASGKKAATFFTEMRKAAVELFAVFEGGKGLKNFLADVTVTDAAVGRTAKTLGMSTEQLSKWQGVAEAAGGTAAGITSAMQGLSQAAQEFFLTGKSAILPYMRTLHLAWDDLKDLRKIADRVEGMNPARAKALLRGLGIADEATINLIISGRKAIQALLDEQERIGPISKKNAEAAQARQKVWAELAQASTSLGRIIATWLTPALVAVNKAFLRLAEWARAHGDFVKAVFVGIAGAVAFLSGSLLIAIARFVVMRSAVGVVIGAVALLYEKWGAIGPLVKKLFGTDLPKTIMDFAGYLGKLSGTITNAFKEAFTAAFEWLKGRFNSIWEAAFGHKLFEDAPGSGLNWPPRVRRGLRPMTAIGGSATRPQRSEVSRHQEGPLEERRRRAAPSMLGSMVGGPKSASSMPMMCLQRRAAFRIKVQGR